jgi:hypothetical protein
LLDPATQQRDARAYTHNVNDLNDLVAQKLTDIRDNVTTSVGDTLAGSRGRTLTGWSHDFGKPARAGQRREHATHRRPDADYGERDLSPV